MFSCITLSQIVNLVVKVYRACASFLVEYMLAGTTSWDMARSRLTSWESLIERHPKELNNDCGIHLTLEFQTSFSQTRSSSQCSCVLAMDQEELHAMLTMISRRWSIHSSSPFAARSVPISTECQRMSLQQLNVTKKNEHIEFPLPRGQ